MGHTSRTLVGAVGSFEVVGVQVGLGMGGGGLLRATARSTLGDGLVVDTLVSGIVGNRGQSTLGDGVLGVDGGCAFCWSVGRRILWSCWMACARAMPSLVEDGTIPPRAVSMLLGGAFVPYPRESVWRSALDKVATCLPHNTFGCSACRNAGTDNVLKPGQHSMHRCCVVPSWHESPEAHKLSFGTHWCK